MRFFSPPSVAAARVGVEEGKEAARCARAHVEKRSGPRCPLQAAAGQFSGEDSGSPWGDDGSFSTHLASGVIEPNRTAELAGVTQHASVAFEQAAIGMAFVDFDGTYVAVNSALCELTGRTERELLGRTWQSITHPNDVRPGEQEVLRTITGEARTFRLAKRYIRPDDQVIWVLLSVSPIRNPLGEPVCLFTQVVDITEQRRGEEELARLASIVESSDDAILTKDFDGTVLTWNRAAERMYGYSEAEMVGRSLYTIVPLDRRAEITELLGRVRQGEPVRNLETVRLRKDGSEIDVSITVSPIRDASGVPVRASTIARDITEHKNLTAQLERTMAALESALDEAHDSEARIRNFLSDAAHHLRNPVAGVRACSETLLRGADPSDRERLLVEIAREMSRVGRLVDRLLRIARIEEGDRLTLETGDIVDVCRHEVERARLLAPHLEVTMTATEAVVLEIDAEAVAEIVGNVLENAREHARGRIDVWVGSDDAGPFVHVIDDGPGLPDGSFDQAFKPFVSLSGKGGAGLGLAVSRALARAHGGDLTYEHNRFVLRLDQGVLLG